MTSNQYWAGVRQMREKLSELSAHDNPDIPIQIHPTRGPFGGMVHITSIDDPMNLGVGGRVCEATIENAAQRLVERTHRISEPAEISKYYEDQRAREDQYAATEMKRSSKTLTITHEQAQDMGIVPRRERSGGKAHTPAPSQPQT